MTNHRDSNNTDDDDYDGIEDEAAARATVTTTTISSRHTVHFDGLRPTYQWSVKQDDRDFYGNRYSTEKQAIKRAADLTKDDALVARYGDLACTLNYSGRVQAKNTPEPTSASVLGSVVSVYGHGKWRVGVVTEATAKRVRVLWTTPSNPDHFINKWYPRVGV